MNDEKFEVDWEVCQSIERLTRTLLKQGTTPAVAREIVLKSTEYKEWTSTVRCFSICCNEIEFYLDLKGAVEFEQYDEDLRSLALQEMNGMLGSSSRDWPYENDRLLLQMGMQIKPTELSYEMGRFSKLLGFETSIGLLEFFSLFTGNASGLLNIDEQKLRTLEQNMIKIEEFVSLFESKYRKADNN
ncbi:hypothetical protein QFZ81_002772 [Paenibacillus sp. V4I9]|uniref:hypothetical protein n=1 Tax=Paenibacillus sp. V4I9 TaxID=3042308 RepID=UPI00278214AF|nr:hypothetical protein [Paenibacillus sp. V4I9]MDQ0887684.1 hypothetical protein [Paenibacillus sp. V4I9]